MKIVATAPNRVDLAGGTLDIFPLDLFLEGGITVNAAIDVFSRAEVESREDGKFRIKSTDQGLDETFDRLDQIGLFGPFSLPARALRHFRPERGLTLSTENAAPKGSGLGASSALLTAICHAVRAYCRPEGEEGDLIQLCANLEAQVLGIPTGRQDYFPATFGGVNAIWFDVEGWRVEPLMEDGGAMKELGDRLVLSFTGESRFSGTNNWNMTKRFIDDEPGIRERFRAIKNTAIEVRKALKSGDFDRFFCLILEEWENRRNLAEGVATPRIDELMDAAKKAGAHASKICGAGGGGCMITCGPSEKKEEIAQALAAAGAKPMNFRVQESGIRVERV